MVRSLLLLLIAVLGFLLVRQERRVSRLKEALSIFEARAHKRILGRLDVKEVPMTWAENATLGEVISQINLMTSRPNFAQLRTGLPTLVDEAGLRAAGQSLSAHVIAPTSEALPLEEHLRRIFEPLGLGYQVRDGALVITSRAAVERTHETIGKLFDRPIAPRWAEGTTLEGAFEKIRLATEGSALPLGLPIYVDPRLEQPLDSLLEDEIAPPSRGEVLSLREHLQRLLEPRGLAYELRHGALVIRSRAPLPPVVAQE
jgi:hypothetical protein